MRLWIASAPLLLAGQTLTTPLQENLLARHAPDVFLRRRLLVKATPQGEILILQGNNPIPLDSFFVLVGRLEELAQLRTWNIQQRTWLRRGRRQQTLGAASLAVSLFVSFKYPPQTNLYLAGVELGLGGWGLYSLIKGQGALRMAHRFAARRRERFSLERLQQWANEYNLKLYQQISSQPVKRFQ